MSPINKDILIVPASDIVSILKNQELNTIEIIRTAYKAHANGHTSVPFSSFLKFPDNPRNRIIALPAYIEAEDEALAGIKWIASFPGNTKHNLPRASAALIMNDMDTGRPYCMLEGSIISAARTAASAAVAADLLLPSPTSELALIGCGPINYEIARYLIAYMPQIDVIHIFDTDRSAAEAFAQQASKELSVHIFIHKELEPLLKKNTLISIATNASEPSITKPNSFAENSLILNISLRDISVELILSSHNVVDDKAHVNRENTSIYHASRLTGGTDFITASIGEIASKKKGLNKVIGKTIIYSPFGLGILDIALGSYVYKQAKNSQLGTIIPNFFMG